MVLVQKWPFFQLFLSGNIGQENILNDILEQENGFLGYKNKKFKRSKNSHFSKGVNLWFWSKNGRFSNFYFYVIQARKLSLTIFQNEKTPFQTIKTRSSKSRKIDIFLKRLTHGFGPKMAIFPILFLGNIGQENAFYDILERKIALLGQNNKKFKKSINSRFSKGVNPQFWSKIGHFSNFFLGTRSQENVFYDILERKNAFLGYQNKNFEKSKN